MPTQEERSRGGLGTRLDYFEGEPEAQVLAFLESEGTDQVVALWDAHEEILRLLAMGKRPRDVAALTGYSPEYISMLRRSPLGRQKLAILNAARDRDCVNVGRQIQENAHKASKFLVDILDGEVEVEVKEKIKVCQDFLSRAGHSHINKNINANVTAGIPEDTLDAIKERALAHEREKLAAGEADWEEVEEEDE